MEERRKTQSGKKTQSEQKTQNGRKTQNAYLTVYLSLCIGVILSLCLTLIEGARRNGTALEASCAAEAGMQSIFAEYHRQLLDQYNLFAVDSSYGSSRRGTLMSEAHLAYYLEKNVDLSQVFLSSLLYRDFFGLQVDGVEMTRVSFLTDGEGAVFRRRASEAVQDDIGLSMLDQLKGWVDQIEVNSLESGGASREKESADQYMRDYEYIDEEGVPHIGVYNPTQVLEEKRRMGILKLAVEDEGQLSHNTLSTDGLVYERMRQGAVSRGNIPLEESPWMQELAERFLFQEYLLRYMGRYGKVEEQDALRYQIEYLIVGKNNDIDNLRGVANRVCALREAANVIYLLTDSVKKAEVELMAEAICGILALPELSLVLQTVIIAGWAYAESVYDVKTLFAGGRIPLFKDAETWHYGLNAALSGDLADYSETGLGMSYEDYLRVFLMLEGLDKLTGRAMNMVEADIRMTPGNSQFCLDGCFDRAEFDIRMSSSYGYRYQLIRYRAYN